MQACFALLPQDNAVRAFRSPRVRASAHLAARFMGGFLAFKVSRRIPISTFGHSNACRQSRRADCGLLHACLRSSAACAFCGVLCVLDGFVMKCPKVETMYLDGVEIPGSVRFVARQVHFGGARNPFWLRAALRTLLPGGATSKYDRGERRTKKTPRRAPCMQISSQEGEHRVRDARALRSGPPCRT